MAGDPTTGIEYYFRKILAIHAARHPARTNARTASEARDFVRRFAGLGPDARSIAEGGLDGVTERNIREAAIAVFKGSEDITTMCRGESRD